MINFILKNKILINFFIIFTLFSYNAHSIEYYNEENHIKECPRIKGKSIFFNNDIIATSKFMPNNDLNINLEKVPSINSNEKWYHSENFSCIGAPKSIENLVNCVRNNSVHSLFMLEGSWKIHDLFYMGKEGIYVRLSHPYSASPDLNSTIVKYKNLSEYMSSIPQYSDIKDLSKDDLIKKLCNKK